MIFMYHLLMIKFAQGLVHYDMFLNHAFLKLVPHQRVHFLNDLINIILSMGLEKDDYKLVGKEIEMDEPYLLYIENLIGVNVDERNGRLIELSDSEQHATLLFLMTLFKVTYQRRYLKEDHRKDWQFWDLSDPENMSRLVRKFEKELDPRFLRSIWK